MTLVVRTPSRLHFGILDLNGSLGRIYGSMGVGINHPSLVLEAQPAEKLSITGPCRTKIRKYAKRFLSKYHLNIGCEIKIHSFIPEHVGFGSDTQTALGVATILSKTFGIKSTIRKLALSLERGQRSGIGIAVFEHGGFVVDGGIKKSVINSTPPEVIHYPFPKIWNFVIAIPAGKKGLRGVRETIAIRNLPKTSEAVSGSICRLIIMKMIPALLEKDATEFGAALTAIQNMTGDAFKSVQGGRFASPIVEECRDMMLRAGATGVGQSSWGPVVYGLVESTRNAERIKKTIQGFLNEKLGGEVFITQANNNGASIISHQQETAASILSDKRI